MATDKDRNNLHPIAKCEQACVPRLLGLTRRYHSSKDQSPLLYLLVDRGSRGSTSWDVVKQTESILSTMAAFNRSVSVTPQHEVGRLLMN